MRTSRKRDANELQCAYTQHHSCFPLVKDERIGIYCFHQRYHCLWEGVCNERIYLIAFSNCARCGRAHCMVIGEDHESWTRKAGRKNCCSARSTKLHITSRLRLDYISFNHSQCQIIECQSDQFEPVSLPQGSMKMLIADDSSARRKPLRPQC